MAVSALSFLYNQISSEDYSLYIGEINGQNLKNDMASTNTEFIMDTVNNRSENFIYGVKQTETNLKFNLKLFGYDKFTKNDITYIDNWLFSNRMPQKLMFCQEDMANYTYHAIFSKNQILYNGNEAFGFDCDIICSSAYGYETEKTDVYNILPNTITKVRFNNLSGGINYLYPKLSFVCNKDNGRIKIINKSDKDRTFEMTGLSNGESIEIDDWFQINTSTGLYRLEKCNKQWLRFKNGINYLDITGDTSKINIKYTFRRGIGS